jgi:HlyD family secretion protein
VATAAVHLALTRLEAPFAGIVADISTEVGEWITPSPPGVPLRGDRPPRPGLSFTSARRSDEVDAERIRLSLPARHRRLSQATRTRPASVAFPRTCSTSWAEPHRGGGGELADASAVTGLLPGTSADVEVILDSRQGVLRIPSAAVAEGNKVLVLASETLAERTIEVGLSNWQFTEVVGGLAEGVAVVVSRASPEVKPGAKAVAETNG